MEFFFINRNFGLAPLPIYTLLPTPLGCPSFSLSRIMMLCETWMYVCLFLFPSTFLGWEKKDIGIQRVISCIKHNPIDHKNIWFNPKKEKRKVISQKGKKKKKRKSMANFLFDVLSRPSFTTTFCTYTSPMSESWNYSRVPLFPKNKKIYLFPYIFHLSFTNLIMMEELVFPTGFPVK